MRLVRMQGKAIGLHPVPDLRQGGDRFFLAAA
jgi:hypothetical protein